MDPEDDLPPIRRSIRLPEVAIRGRRDRHFGTGDTAEDVAESEARKGPAAHSAEGIPFGGSERVRAIAEAHPEHAPSLPESLDRAIGEALGPGDALARVPRAVRRVGRAAADAGFTSAPALTEPLAQYTETGTAPLTGAITGASSGLADEIAGLVGGAADVSSGRDFVPGYERHRDAARARLHRDEESSPIAFGVGEIGGAAAQNLVLPGGRAATMGGRLARGMAEGGALTGLGAFGNSENTGADLARDTAAGVGLGAAGGTLGALLGETGSRASQAIARRAANADELRVAAAVGSGNSPLSDRAARMVDRLPGGMREAARAIRSSPEGAPGYLDTIEDYADRLHQMSGRTGREVGAFNDAIDAALPAEGVSARRFTEPLRDTSDDLIREAAREDASRVSGIASNWDDMASAHHPSWTRETARVDPHAVRPNRGDLPIPTLVPERGGGRMTSPVRDAMGRLREEAYRGLTPTADLDAYRTLRGAYDDVAGEVLPPSVMEGFRPARNAHARAALLESLSASARSRALRSPGPGLGTTTMLGSVADLVPGGAAGRAAAMGGIGRWRAAAPSRAATHAELARWFLERDPEVAGRLGLRAGLGLREISLPSGVGGAAARTAATVGGEEVADAMSSDRATPEAAPTPDRTMTAAEIDALFDEDEGARPMTAEEIDALFDEEGTDR